MSPPPLRPGALASAHAVARRLLSPIQRFLEIEAASGLALIAATVIALAWASSPWSSSYGELWGRELGAWGFDRSLRFWVDDGLMTIFFFVVGLEIRREMHEGVLSDLRAAALPLVAAIGGMLAPAAIFTAFNLGRDGSRGWGVPMATDIAFAVGALALLGRRVTPAARVLLLALAVIDDLGAIVVIAVFYSAGLAPDGLLLVAGGIAAIALLRVVAVRIPALYLLPGVVVWAGLYRAGIHPTIAGVVVGMLTPAAPAASLQQALHRWVAFVIMPLFALANAGLELGAATLSGDALFVFLGIVAGLALGKPIGIAFACRLGIGARIAARPQGVSRESLAVIGAVAGIGFTMALFTAQLAFPPGPLLETAKLAILVGSLVAAVGALLLGAAILRSQSA